jgi:hypothetical protein
MLNMTHRFVLIHTCLVTVALHMGVSVARRAQAAGAGRDPTPALLDRNKEVALALSACPAAVAGKAAVYVLDKSGYVKVRESQNGFTALVQHSMITSQEPQCMDSEGTRTFLPRMLKVAELRAQGKSAKEIQAIIAAEVAKGVLQPPTRPAFVAGEGTPYALVIVPVGVHEGSIHSAAGSP